VLDGENLTKTLREVGISDNSTVFMCLKLLGGSVISIYLCLADGKILLYI